MQGLHSLEPFAIRSFYAELCCTATTPAPSPTMCQQASLQHYTAGLQTAAAVQQKAVKASTNKSRHAIVTELISWLQQLNMANKSMQTVMPEDILVFLVQQWLPNHAGSATSSAELIAAPNSLATAKSHLSKEFELLGRTGDWNAHIQQGNPLESLHVREFIKGYKTHAAELGYQKRGAVPFSGSQALQEEADMIQLLQQLYLQQQTLTGTDQLLLLRDGFIFSLLWQSCFRGFNAGGIRLQNIVLPTGGSALPFLLPTVQLQPGAQLHFIPETTKNKKGGHCNVTLTRDVLCFSSWFALLSHAHLAAGQPITNYITRPLNSSGKVFSEAPMSSPATWARLTKYLKEYGMYKGQSVHSTRRGSMLHHKEVHQATFADIGEAAMCTQETAKYYTDRHRPTRLRSKPY